MYTTQKSVYKDGKNLTEAVCLSTDTKPTDGIANGSLALEMDTGDVYMFDEAGGEWIKLEDSGGGGGDAEVWLVGNEYADQGGVRIFTLSNVGETDHITELVNNASSYDVYLNDIQLPHLSDYTEGQNHHVVFSDGETEQTSTKVVSLELEQGITALASAIYVDASTAPTSVEVSVKAK